MSKDDRAMEHETAFVRSFIVRQRRERWLTQLASSKKRARFLDRLNHRFHNDLDVRFIVTDPPRTSGSRSCYMIASETEYDGRFVAESEIPDIVAAANFGIIVSLVPGKLACYKDEAPADVIWMQRN